MRTKIAGVGMYVPETVIPNELLTQFMDTSDAWIQERTGIVERRYADGLKETTATMGIEAAKAALDNAGITAKDVDFIIFATLCPDYYMPGCGVLVQRALHMNNVGALDIRNQCSGFLYALSTADQFIKTGMYKNILLIASEKQSGYIDFSTRGRDVAVIFGDGAGAVVLQPTEEDRGILSTHLHSDGGGAEILGIANPGTHSNHWTNETLAEYEHTMVAGITVRHTMVDAAQCISVMNGPEVFKNAVVKFPEVINEALDKNGYTPKDIDLLITHQANLRISKYVQKTMGLSDDQVFNNIQKYGNTSSASIPLALCEALQAGKVKDGDLLCMATFGSGFTWASALVKW